MKNMRSQLALEARFRSSPVPMSMTPKPSTTRRTSSEGSAIQVVEHHDTKHATRMSPAAGGAAHHTDFHEIERVSSSVHQNKTRHATSPEHAMPIQAERQRWEGERQAGLDRRLRLLYQGDADRFGDRKPNADRKQNASSANSAAYAAAAAATPKEPAQLRSAMLRGDRCFGTLVSPTKIGEHGMQWPPAEPSSGPSSPSAAPRNLPTPAAERAGMLDSTSETSVQSGSDLLSSSNSQHRRSPELDVPTPATPRSKTSVQSGSGSGSGSRRGRGVRFAPQQEVRTIPRRVSFEGFTD